MDIPVITVCLVDESHECPWKAGVTTKSSFWIFWIFLSIASESTVRPFYHLYMKQSGADPGFDQGGGPDCDRPKLPMVRSSVV